VDALRNVPPYTVRCCGFFNRIPLSTRKHAPVRMTTVRPCGKDANHARNAALTSTEQLAAIDAGGETLGPGGSATCTEPPASPVCPGARAVAVVRDVAVEDVVDERPADADPRRGAPAPAQADAVTAITASTRRNAERAMRRWGVTRGAQYRFAVRR
jgi:hypothetical protein